MDISVLDIYNFIYYLIYVFYLPICSTKVLAMNCRIISNNDGCDVCNERSHLWWNIFYNWLLCNICLFLLSFLNHDYIRELSLSLYLHSNAIFLFPWEKFQIDICSAFINYAIYGMGTLIIVICCLHVEMLTLFMTHSWVTENFINYTGFSAI